ncbi:Sec-independent protein translocase protein TatB [Denitromonas iodatirespirans]|uniref:Sec-independent protein translocase protein TatB n=1 Tax=Denitromonas iodatirespirans TaxID=2795389 RepID=A0A944HE74_DENI1|nr:Sec-independent protein translocase protein TatB [Denitromonas iodatirespirans]MBT0962651.1 twin-arginine translocase subunit TatB [Denitromonas iodatirespirans]
MFDIGFTELMIIAIVGLVVIGPERLPKVARTVGHMLGRLQRYVGDVKSDIQREMHLEDLKKLQKEMTDSARDLESGLRGQAAAVQADLDDAAKSVKSTAEAPAGTATQSPDATDEEAIKDAERAIAQTVADDIAANHRPPERDDNQLALGLDAEPAAPASKEPKA